HTRSYGDWSSDVCSSDLPGSVTGGSAANAGQEPLFTLVPLDAPVEADVHVSASDIGFVKIGDPVEIKLDAYRYTQHGTAQGVIRDRKSVVKGKSRGLGGW